MPRELLYERINKRCEKMLQQGLIEEVRKLYEKYGECQPMRAIGYKEVLPYLKGEITEEQMKELISQHTRNYAKRQLTWFRKNNDYTWLPAEHGIQNNADIILKELKNRK